MRDDQLAAKPFHLDGAAIAWVRDTLNRLTPDDKIRQLFNLRAARYRRRDAGALHRVPARQHHAQSGRRLATKERREVAAFNAAAPVPLLVSADLEGSRMSLAGGAELPNPLALAAIDDVDATTAISDASWRARPRTSASTGSFTPVLDINEKFKSAIVATRGFGSDVATIERHALAQLDAFQTNGVAVAIKHWPGEGFDDRDQHLVTTVNPLSMDEWETNFGRLYRAAIEAGALSVMVGHIALPAFIRQGNPDAGVEAYRPASISRDLTVDAAARANSASTASSSPTRPAWPASNRGRRAPTICPRSSMAAATSSSSPTTPIAIYGFIAAALEDGRLAWAAVDEAVTRAARAQGRTRSPQAGPRPAGHRHRRKQAPRRGCRAPRPDAGQRRAGAAAARS